ncbi:ABC transporter ATP-binding protein [Niallia sp. 01092]|uniref:ABC transporter ATP-binding protein n=1 Tax=unclassified Niallia TaxID=2837522 RepID=UPI003FD6B4FE
MSLLDVKNLFVHDIRTGEEIVKNLHFSLERNTCLGIVGESGSGKSMTAKAILGLTSPWLETSGVINFAGENLLNATREQLRMIRGQKICMILQDAHASFNPLYTIGKQMSETFREHFGVRKKDAIEMAVDALEKMNIHHPAQVIKKYPHQLSGGMLQRCMIAIAMTMKPDIIIADEPTTALDAINQQEVVEEFKRIRELTGTSMIFISHDLGVIQYLAQDVLVMQNGACVEYGKSEELFADPKHDFTKYLIERRLSLSEPFQQSIRHGGIHHVRAN